MNFNGYPKIIIASSMALFLVGCATESHRALETPTVKIAQTAYHGAKALVSVGKFNNQSTYQNGIFSNGEDRLGSQASTILVTSLKESGRFSVLERTNMQNLKQESEYAKIEQNIKGARFVVTGDVTEFGRKTTGDKQLFGILGKGKTQTAYAKVNLNVVDVKTSEVVYSAQGAGEYALSEREVVGFGSTAGYDSTLNAKVLSLAIREAVDKLAVGVESGMFLTK